jgi:hypothetical protein
MGQPLESLFKAFIIYGGACRRGGGGYINSVHLRLHATTFEVTAGRDLAVINGCGIGLWAAEEKGVV